MESVLERIKFLEEKLAYLRSEVERRDAYYAGYLQLGAQIQELEKELDALKLGLEAVSSAKEYHSDEPRVRVTK